MGFSAKERFPHACGDVRNGWTRPPPSPGLDPFNAVATLTHDPKSDDLALRLALASDCFYVGALGSKKTHARRVERLVASEIEPAALARPRAPIGLDIGAAQSGGDRRFGVGEFAGLYGVETTRPAFRGEAARLRKNSARR